MKILDNGKTLVDVQSESDPTCKYEVDLVHLRCSCLGWRFTKGRFRLCKHLRALGYTEDSLKLMYAQAGKAVPAPPPNSVINKEKQPPQYTEAQLKGFADNL